MPKRCHNLRTQLENIKALHSDYCLELEQAKITKEYELALSIQPKLTQAILELRAEIDPEKYGEARITEIERKHKANIPLSKAEIIFLYDVDCKFHSYDQDRDPRIVEILKNRDPQEDMPIAFDCHPSEVARDIKEINENTKAYIGSWSVEVFQVLINYPNITHLYESFPDKKIFMQTLETDPSINSPAKAEQALRDKKIYLDSWGEVILEKTEFSQTREVYNLVRFTVGQLGLKEGATTNEIYIRAERLGLELCLAEIGPQLRLKYTGRELFWIAMKQIADRNGDPHVFHLNSDNAELWLDGRFAEPINGWSIDAKFVFRFRRKNKKDK